jgi:hypothetical protein
VTCSYCDVKQAPTYAYCLACGKRFECSIAGVETVFQDMFGPPQEPAWERSIDEHGGRIFRKKDNK